MSRYDAEIDLYVASLEQRSKGNTAATYHFNAPVGAVMTGNNSTANIVQNIGDQDRDNLLHALDEIKQAIRQQKNIPTLERDQLVEVIEDGENEAKKEQPNMIKLKSYINTIIQTARGIKDVAGAVEAVQQIGQKLFGG